MLSEKGIEKCYNDFKRELDTKINLPKLRIKNCFGMIESAQIGSSKDGYIELFLGEIFTDKNILNQYLIQILYHEFTHILDKMSLLTDIIDEDKQRNQLFPYTEFHASKVEISKKLELFYNPNKVINANTTIYGRKKRETLKNFLENELNEFFLASQLLRKHPCIEHIQLIVYILIYNIGYYDICRKYNLNLRYFIYPNEFGYIITEYEEMKRLLLTELPSDKLCVETNKIVNSIVFKIAKHYNLR